MKKISVAFLIACCACKTDYLPDVAPQLDYYSASKNKYAILFRMEVLSLPSPTTQRLSAQLTDSTGLNLKFPLEFTNVKSNDLPVGWGLGGFQASPYIKYRFVVKADNLVAESMIDISKIPATINQLMLTTSDKSVNLKLTLIWL